MWKSHGKGSGMNMGWTNNLPFGYSVDSIVASKINQKPIFSFKSGRHTNVISIVKPTRCTNVSNLFYFGMTIYMFWTVFPSITRSSRLYIQQQAFVKQILLSASWQADSKTAVSVWQIPVAVCTVLNSWWWTERLSETCRVSFQNKINLIHWCI